MCCITKHTGTQKYVPKLLINKNKLQDKIFLDFERPKGKPKYPDPSLYQVNSPMDDSKNTHVVVLKHVF